MEKAIVVYVPVIDACKAKRRPEVLAESLTKLNDLLADGWSVKQSSPLGTGSEAAACNLVILQKGDEA